MVCRWPLSQEGDLEDTIWHDMGLDLSGNGSSETMYDEQDRNLAEGQYKYVKLVMVTTDLM